MRNSCPSMADACFCTALAASCTSQRYQSVINCLLIAGCSYQCQLPASLI